MDPEEVRVVLTSYGVDLWALIDAAIAVAARDHAGELRARRDAIVKRLYSPEPTQCRSCAAPEDLGHQWSEAKETSSPEAKLSASSPSTPRSDPEDDDDDEGEQHRDQDQEDHRMNPDRPIDSEQRRILAIKELIEDPDQPEEVLVKRLQKLADMEITFKALKETDIGRHVNGLRKHSSGEVRRLVKLLVRKWKDLVDEWVKSNSDDTDSPQQLAGKMTQNGHQVVDFGYSPNPHDGGLGLEMESRGKNIPRRDAPPKPSPPPPPKVVNEEKEKDGLIDPERLASARKRLHENYQEAQNAKKQRTIQVMDIHEIPKTKNSFFPRNKGGSHGKHW